VLLSRGSVRTGVVWAFPMAEIPPRRILETHTAEEALRQAARALFGSGLPTEHQPGCVVVVDTAAAAHPTIRVIREALGTRADTQVRVVSIVVGDTAGTQTTPGEGRVDTAGPVDASSPPSPPFAGPSSPSAGLSPSTAVTTTPTPPCAVPVAPAFSGLSGTTVRVQDLFNSPRAPQREVLTGEVAAALRSAVGRQVAGPTARALFVLDGGSLPLVALREWAASLQPDDLLLSIMHHDCGRGTQAASANTAASTAGTSAWLHQCAAAGLFCVADMMWRVEGGQATVSVMRRQDYSVTHPTPADLEALVALEHAAWPHAHLQASREELERRITACGDTCHVARDAADGTVCAAVYAQRINGVATLASATKASLPSLHSPQGRVLNLLAVVVLPRYQGRNLGNSMLDVVLQLSRPSGTFRMAAAVSPLKELHEIRGADIGAQVPDFVHGHPVPAWFVVQYPMAAAQPAADDGVRAQASHHNSVAVSLSAAVTVAERGDVESELRRIMGTLLTAGSTTTTTAAAAAGVDGSAARIGANTPFMDLGFDSLTSARFRSEVNAAFGLAGLAALPPTMMFDFPTLDKLTTAVSSALGLPPGTRSAASAAVATTTSPPAQVSDATGRCAFASEPLAIVAMACSFPGNQDGSHDAGHFWHTLTTSGTDAVDHVPFTRWDANEEKGRGVYCEQGGFIAGHDLFDPQFFGMSDRETVTMDPHQRQVLQVAYSTLHRGGYTKATLMDANIGVFVGASNTGWSATLEARKLQGEDVGGAMAGTGVAASILANRVSYTFGLTGPSMTVDTACSSSLVALHTACGALRNGDCEAALVAGVDLMLSPADVAMRCDARMLAKDGRCKTFDAAANG